MLFLANEPAKKAEINIFDRTRYNRVISGVYHMYVI